MHNKINLPILDHDPAEQSVFLPGNILKAARLQKALPPCRVPDGCLLDFDGELIEYLIRSGRAKEDPAWPCFHTRLYRWFEEDGEFGLIGGTVGAPFAVLVAEELLASGCRGLVSISSAGLLASSIPTPFFLLIDRALRDEGASYHYLPPERFSYADERLVSAVEKAVKQEGLILRRGASWTTDAPFRETARRIEACRDEGIVSVEMEAAALLSFARAREKRVVCLAHVTNMMATSENDFDKGGDEGTQEALRLCRTALTAVLEYEEGGD